MSDRSHQPDIFLTGLLLLFIALKLTGAVAWPWWWVLAPLWAPLIVVLIVLAAVVFWSRK